MKRNIKVNLFFGIIAAIAIIIAIFALTRPRVATIPHRDYEEIIVLNDTIRALKKEIVRYQDEIARIDLERKTIRDTIRQIINDKEKGDIELANGDWDNNIRFLTDFLSEEDSVGG